MHKIPRVILATATPFAVMSSFLNPAGAGAELKLSLAGAASSATTNSLGSEVSFTNSAITITSSESESSPEDGESFPCCDASLSSGALIDVRFISLGGFSSALIFTTILSLKDTKSLHSIDRKAKIGGVGPTWCHGVI